MVVDLVMVIVFWFVKKLTGVYYWAFGGVAKGRCRMGSAVVPTLQRRWAAASLARLLSSTIRLLRFCGVTPFLDYRLRENGGKNGM